MPYSTMAALTTVFLLAFGCSLPVAFFDRGSQQDGQQDTTRRIEVEVDDPEHGLPCRVIYRPDAKTRDVLWHARFERGFCHRKADEARLILESRGLICERENLERSPTSDRSGSQQKVVLAWRCQQREAATLIAPRPSPPRPATASREAPRWGDQVITPELRAVLERDLATLGGAFASQTVISGLAHGDLDQDDQSDAVVLLTRQVDDRATQYLILAYLGGRETYLLADVEVLTAPQLSAARKFDVAIDDGLVRLQTCCGDDPKTTVLTLQNRELELKSQANDRP